MTSDTALDEALLRELAERALQEDHAWQDITTAALVPDDQRGRAVIVARAAGVLAGLPAARAVFAAVSPAIQWQPFRGDGERVSQGERLVLVEGPLGRILSAERAALNFLTHLSGVATATAAVVEAMRGTGCRLRDTRKTIPGLRVLEKYAVRVGGGMNHRLHLAGGILIKDNHLAALRARGLGIHDAVHLARRAHPGVRIEIEVGSVAEALEAMEAGAEELLLDNMALAEVREVVALARSREPRPVLEASGGITMENARAYAETGVDYISMGAITHSARSLDMGLELE